MENLSSYLSGWKNKNNGRMPSFGRNPESDWRIIFTATATLVLLVSVLSAYMFLKINRGEIFTTEKPSKQDEKVLDTVVLKETVLYYQNKALEFQKIKNQRHSIPDPSL